MRESFCYRLWMFLRGYEKRSVRRIDKVERISDHGYRITEMTQEDMWIRRHLGSS